MHISALALLVAAQAPPVSALPTLRASDGPLSLAVVDVSVHIEGRLATTEIAETFHNAAARQTEGTYTLELPAGASLSRVALEIDGKLVEGELVERERARSVYENIVRHQKDPALVEWQGQDRFQMNVFPIPANGDKRVVAAWEQVLPETSAGVSYALPLTGAAIGHLRVSVVVAGRSARVTGLPIEMRGDPGALVGHLELDDAAVAAPLHVDALPDVPLPRVRVGLAHDAAVFVADVALGAGASGRAQGPARDVVIALDTSAGIGARDLARSIELARAVVRGLPPGARYAVVHGDLDVDTCVAAGANGAVAGNTAALDGCARVLDAGGASDLGALLQTAVTTAKSFHAPASVLLIGDGVASLGELDEDLLRGTLVESLRGDDVTVHAVMIGVAPAEDTLRALTRAGGGHATRMTPVSSTDGAAEDVLRLLRVPLVTAVQAKVVEGTVADLTPGSPVDAARGEAVAFMGRLTSARAVLEVSGTVAGKRLVERVVVNRGSPAADAPLGRAWARARIAALETATDVDRAPVVALSREWGVMSRYTSFLVLENDEAYKRFAVDRARQREHDAASSATNADGTDNVDAPAASANLKKSAGSLQDLVGAEASASSGASYGAASVSMQGAAMKLDIAAPTPAEPVARDERSLEGSMGGIGLRGSGGGGGGYGAGEGAMGKRASAAPMVSAGAAVVMGSLDQNIIRRVVKQHESQVRYCYERELVRTPGLNGRLVMRWSIDGSGTVKSVAPETNDMGTAVSECVAAKIRSWRFPPVMGGGIVVVTFPWIFRSNASGGGGSDGEPAVPDEKALRAALAAHPDDVSTASSLYDLLVTDNDAASARALASLAPKGAAALELFSRASSALSAPALTVLLDAWVARGVDDDLVAAMVAHDASTADRYTKRVFAAASAILRAGRAAGDELVVALAKTGAKLGRSTEAADVLLPLCADAARAAACDESLPLLRADPRVKEAVEHRFRTQLDEVVARRHSVDMADADDVVLEASLRDKLGSPKAARRTLSELVEFAPHDYGARIRYAGALTDVGSACGQLALAVQLSPAERDTFLSMMHLRRDHPDEARAIRKCIVDSVSKLPVQRALSIVLTWEDDSADVDLHVFEPGGGEVWYQQRESDAGGFLYHDVTDGFGPEIYVLGPKVKGNYHLKLVHYAGGHDRIRGTVTILRHAGSAEETRQDFPFEIGAADTEKQIPLTELRL